MLVSSDSSVSCEELEKVVIGEDIDRYFQVGVQLPMEDKRQLINFLKDNLNVFSWSAYEALEVDPEFICHHLNVNPKAIPKKQLPRHSSKQHTETMKDKVYKYKQARAIKEVFYLE